MSERNTYTSVGLALRSRSPSVHGMATVLDDGKVTGHVTIYTDGGSWTVRSEHSEALERVAAELRKAAARMREAAAGQAA